MSIKTMNIGWLSHIVMKSLEDTVHTGYEFSGKGITNDQRAPMIALK